MKTFDELVRATRTNLFDVQEPSSLSTPQKLTRLREAKAQIEVSIDLAMETADHEFTDDLIPVHTDNLMQQHELYKHKEIRIKFGSFYPLVDKRDRGALLSIVEAHAHLYKAWMTPDNRILYIKHL